MMSVIRLSCFVLCVLLARTGSAATTPVTTRAAPPLASAPAPASAPATQGLVRFQLRDGPVKAESLAFSDSQVLAGGSAGGVDRWELAGGKPIAADDTFGDIVHRVAWSADGLRYAATGHLTHKDLVGMICVWQDKQLIARLKPGGPCSRDIAFRNGKPNQLFAMEDTQVCLWDIARQTVIATFRGVAGPPKYIDQSPDGKLLLVVHVKGEFLRQQTYVLTVFDVETRNLLWTVQVDTERYSFFPFSPDSKHLLHIHRGLIDARSVTDGRITTTAKLSLPGVTDGPRFVLKSATFTPDGKTLTLLGDDSRVYHSPFDLNKLQWERVNVDWHFTPRTLQYTRDAKRLIVTGADEQDKIVIGVLDPSYRPAESAAVPYAGARGEFQFLANGQIIIARNPPEFRIYDIKSPEPRVVFRPTLKKRPTRLAFFSPDATLAVTQAEGKRLQVVATASGESLLTMPYACDDPRVAWVDGNKSVCITDVKAVADSKLEYAVHLWDVREKKESAAFTFVAPFRHDKQLWSPDGRFYAATIAEPPVPIPSGKFIAVFVHVWSAQTGKKVYVHKTTMTSPGFEDFVFTPQGMIVVAGDTWTHVQLPTGKLIAPPSTPLRIESPQIDPKGRTVIGFATWADRRVLSAFDLASGKLNWNCPLENTVYRSPLFSADGTRILAMTTRHSMVMLDAATGKELTRFNLSPNDESTPVFIDGTEAAVLRFKDEQLSLHRLKR